MPTRCVYHIHEVLRAYFPGGAFDLRGYYGTNSIHTVVGMEQVTCTIATIDIILFMAITHRL